MPSSIATGATGHGPQDTGSATGNKQQVIWPSAYLTSSLRHYVIDHGSQTRLLRHFTACIIVILTRSHVIPLLDYWLVLQLSIKISHSPSFFIVSLLPDPSIPRSPVGLRTYSSMASYRITHLSLYEQQPCLAAFLLLQTALGIHSPTSIPDEASARLLVVKSHRSSFLAGTGSSSPALSFHPDSNGCRQAFNTADRAIEGSSLVVLR